MSWRGAPYVTRRHVDAVTGQRVERTTPGAVWDGYELPVWFQGSTRPQWVTVDAAEVKESAGRYPALKVKWRDLEERAQQQHAAQQKAKKQGKLRPQVKQKHAGVAETFRTAGEGAADFLSNNWEMLETVGDLDVEDQVRDLLDGFEVRRGRKRKDGTYKFVRLNKTAKGAEILDAFRSSAERGAMEFLTWLFSQVRSKRWREVDWPAVDELGEILTTTCIEESGREGRRSQKQCIGWTWYPPGAELRPLAERLSELPERASRAFEVREHAKRLAELVKDLRAAVKKAKACLPEETEKAIRERINYLAKLSREPWRIPAATICGEDPQTGYQLCGFPAIEAEVVQLRKACERGYDPRWPLAQSLAVDEAERLGLPVIVAQERDAPDVADELGPGPTLEELQAIPWEPSEENPKAEPPSPGSLPPDGRRMLWSTYEDAKKHYRKQGERGAALKRLAARVAWAQVGRHFYKRGAKWQKRRRPLKPNPDELDLRQQSLGLDGSKPKAPRGARAATRSNPKPRNPYGELLDLRARVMQLEVETPRGVEVHTWHRDRPALFWSEKRRALVWVHGGKDPTSWQDVETSGPVASRHRRWHGDNPSEVGELELPAGRLSKLGPALRIVYSAERYRDGTPRHHDFGADVAAYRQNGRGARVFEVRGGRLTLTERGLVY